MKKFTKHKSGKLALLHVNASSNNTIISLCDKKGEVKYSSSCGQMLFKGAKRSTSYAAQAAACDLASKGKDAGYTQGIVLIKGFGSGRASVLKGFSLGGISILAIIDVTPFPHNGCRPPKIRRL
uniref:Ribosomal protein S11 n=1 Tax=Jakoba libera TaxID=143017 RepID=M4QCB1_JAKLI|nr:ribosomal protein S11 [Jakoba libera]AGH24199.1 ribosomal protein S11 [Jakoba libera]